MKRKLGCFFQKRKEWMLAGQKISAIHRKYRIRSLHKTHLKTGQKRTKMGSVPKIWEWKE